MRHPLADLPPRLLRTQEAARFLGISLRTLEKHRTYGTGPTYRKIGGRVLYSVGDLEAWTVIGARKSTRDTNCRHGLSRAPAHSRRAGRALNVARRRSLTRAVRRHQRTQPSRPFRGCDRGCPAARPARLDGAAVLLAREDAAHQADSLQGRRCRGAGSRHARTRHGDHLGRRRADLGRFADRRGREQWPHDFAFCPLHALPSSALSRPPDRQPAIFAAQGSARAPAIHCHRDDDTQRPALAASAILMDQRVGRDDDAQPAASRAWSSSCPNGSTTASSIARSF